MGTKPESLLSAAGVEISDLKSKNKLILALKGLF